MCPREQLQLVPEKLEARISEKRFLTAVEVLQDALETIRRPEIENIGALTDLRVYFSNQETVCQPCASGTAPNKIAVFNRHLNRRTP